MVDNKQSIFKSLMHPKFIFNNFNQAPEENTSGNSKSSSPLNAYARRRQQVRRAQKNHRLKKENYISALEAEVTRLRELVAQQQNLNEIQAENQTLRELLAVHGIMVPPPVRPSKPGITQDSVQVSLVGEPGTGQHLEPSPEQNLTGEGQFYPPSSPAQTGPMSIPTPPNPQIIGNAPDMSLEAFDFVLRLEQPCLAHTHPKDGSPQAPGHTLTLQSASFAYAPPNSGSDSSWRVPVGEMKRLLDLSAMLPLDGELTPIQAWSQLMDHPGASSLARETLQELASRLAKNVQCYGFGAVIDELVFQEILASFLR